MSNASRKSSSSVAAVLVLGAGLIVQPAGGVKADTPSSTPSSQPAKPGKTVTDPIELKTNTATGHYLRKKLPGRMKSGQITITRAPPSSPPASGPGAATPKV
jgi:hypothetical protein